jgi:hypothetical protein
MPRHCFRFIFSNVSEEKNKLEKKPRCPTEFVMPVAMKSDRSPMNSPLSAKAFVGTVEQTINAGNVCNVRSGSPKSSQDQQSQKHGHHWEKSGKIDKLANQIFVGGIPLKTSPQRFRAWADETWPGLVAGVRLIGASEKHVPAKNADAKDTAMASRPRGFGFVTFSSSEAASHAVQNQHYVFSGERTVEVKKVHPNFANFVLRS